MVMKSSYRIHLLNTVSDLKFQAELETKDHSLKSHFNNALMFFFFPRFATQRELLYFGGTMRADRSHRCMASTMSA